MHYMLAKLFKFIWKFFNFFSHQFLKYRLSRGVCFFQSLKGAQVTFIKFPVIYKILLRFELILEDSGTKVSCYVLKVQEDFGLRSKVVRSKDEAQNLKVLEDLVEGSI